MKMRKCFFAMMMLALITLLSGMIQSKDRIAESNPTYALDNSPPTMQPTMINATVPDQSVVWISQSMPGLQYQSSSVSDKTIQTADVLSTIIINNKDCNARLYVHNSNQSRISIYDYRQPRDGLSQS